MQISVYNEFGSSIKSVGVPDCEHCSFEEMIKEQVSNMEGIGDKCMVEVMYFTYPTGERELRRKWFSVHKKSAPANIQFYRNVIGVKSPVDMVDMVDVVRSLKQRPDTKMFYFSTHNFGEIGIMFYEMATVNAFFSKYDKFRFHGIEYTREVIPETVELVVECIMG